jgi:cellobiose-specific phosphotransferase system component IIA
MDRIKFATIISIILMISSVSGCLGIGASAKNQYANYLNEFNNGNLDFNHANSHYDKAIKYYGARHYEEAASEMSAARNGYNDASQHYDKMVTYSDNEDQHKYAESLELEAQNCMYASASFMDAYNAYAMKDITRGNKLLEDANNYVEQAKKYYDRAISYESKAIK